MRGLKIGNIIDKTLGVLEYSAVPAVIYIAAVTAITGPVNYFAQGSTAPTLLLGATLANFVVGISAAYLLLDAMVRRTGLRTRSDADVFVPYLGLSILYTLGVMLGFIALILPGLFVMARWIMAQPILIARGTGIKEALGASWEETNGSEFTIIGAALALMLVPVAIMIGSALVLDKASVAGVGVSQLASSAMSAVMLAMGVAIYGLFESAKAAAGKLG